jgi:hypothetical protein
VVAGLAAPKRAVDDHSVAADAHRLHLSEQPAGEPRLLAAGAVLGHPGGDLGGAARLPGQPGRLLGLVRYNRDTIEASRSMLIELQTNPKARSLAFDACAGASIMELLRESGGRQIPTQEYEIRCRKAQEEKTNAH